MGPCCSKGGGSLEKPGKVATKNQSGEEEQDP